MKSGVPDGEERPRAPRCASTRSSSSARGLRCWSCRRSPRRPRIRGHERSPPVRHHEGAHRKLRRQRGCALGEPSLDTDDAGLVVTLADGSEFRVTVVQSWGADSSSGYPFVSQQVPLPTASRGDGCARPPSSAMRCCCSVAARRRRGRRQGPRPRAVPDHRRRRM